MNMPVKFFCLTRPSKVTNVTNNLIFDSPKVILITRALVVIMNKNNFTKFDNKNFNCSNSHIFFRTRWFLSSYHFGWAKFSVKCIAPLIQKCYDLKIRRKYTKRSNFILSDRFHMFWPQPLSLQNIYRCTKNC